MYLYIYFEILNNTNTFNNVRYTSIEWCINTLCNNIQIEGLLIIKNKTQFVRLIFSFQRFESIQHTARCRDRSSVVIVNINRSNLAALVAWKLHSARTRNSFHRNTKVPRLEEVYNFETSCARSDHLRNSSMSGCTSLRWLIDPCGRRPRSRPPGVRK